MKTTLNQFIKRFTVAVLVLASITVANAQSWDAATCRDLCYIVANQGYYIDDVLVAKCHYTIFNNFNTDEGFVTIYSRNVNYDAYGEPSSLSKSGVSSIIMANRRSEGPITIQITLFNSTNAQKFLNQALELGFKKVKRTKDSTIYQLSNLALEAVDSQRAKQFTFYNFIVQPAYMY